MYSLRALHRITPTSVIQIYSAKWLSKSLRNYDKVESRMDTAFSTYMYILNTHKHKHQLYM